MELSVNRSLKTPDFTLGEMAIDGKLAYFTCEDAIRNVKVAGQTAIPTGRYQIIINNSERFQRRMPLLLNVPGFEGIRIHSGNTSSDTEGCILIGLTRGKIGVLNSRAAFDDFFPKLDAALQKDKVWITIA